jgi:hypothetical protein
MEIILNLLKQLASTLSPTEFLVVCIIIIVAVTSLVKVILKMHKKGGILAVLSSKDSEVTLEELGKKVEALMPSAKHADATNSILLAITQAGNEAKARGELAQFNSATAKADLSRLEEHIRREFNDASAEMRLQSAQSRQSLESVSEVMRRSQDMLQRITQQLDKIDSFASMMAPEFRADHKELDKELSSLRHDISRIENLIQNQINNASALKLR